MPYGGDDSDNIAAESLQQPQKLQGSRRATVERGPLSSGACHMPGKSGQSCVAQGFPRIMEVLFFLAIPTWVLIISRLLA